MGRKSSYNESKVAIICKAIADGETYKVACIRAGISDETFSRWRKKYVDFENAIKKAEQDYNEWYSNELIRDCKKSLKTLIMGTEIEETKTEYESDPKNPDVPRIKRQTVVTKRVLPNPTAIIFALTNRDPDNWKNRQSNEISGELKTTEEVQTDLSKLPDDLLEQVLDKLND